MTSIIEEITQISFDNDTINRIKEYCAHLYKHMPKPEPRESFTPLEYLNFPLIIKSPKHAFFMDYRKRFIELRSVGTPKGWREYWRNRFNEIEKAWENLDPEVKAKYIHRYQMQSICLQITYNRNQKKWKKLAQKHEEERQNELSPPG